MSQQSIEKSIDYVLNYNLYFCPKKQLYQYLHQIARVADKPEIADVYINAIPELSPDNAREYSIPQHVENALLESINKMLENLRSGQIISHWDSTTTWFKTLKNLCATNLDSCRLALILCALLKDNAGALEFALNDHKNADTLLSSNADLTALMLAADWGSAECVKALLEADADVNAKDGDNNTVLMRAAGSGHAECVKLLLAAKVDVEAKNSIGKTALMWAAHKGKTKCVKVLLTAKANVNAGNNNNATALYYAAQEGHVECVKTLVEAKADVNAKTKKEGRPALMIAAQNGHAECLKALLEAGADVNARNSDGWTVLKVAAKNGKAECVKALLNANAIVNTKDSDGWTALMSASQEGHTECVKMILEAKAEVNARANNCWTALMIAAYYGRTECVKALLEEGADWQQTSNKGNTALDIARQSEKSNDATRNLLIREKRQLDEALYQLRKKQYFWKECYSITNIIIAVIFVAWVSISIWQKWSIKGSGIDITLYIIGCLVPLIFKAYISYRADYNDRPDNKTACIAYGVTDFFCAMALCLPAISNKILDSFSGVVWLSILVQLVIGVLLGYKVIKLLDLDDVSPRTICVWNVIITITLFYMGGAVMTGGYDFLSNMRAILTLGYY